jgi:hypothetical protein
MPSELQRVARGLVGCFDEIPRVVEQLQRTAVRCRENAQLALIASRGQATVAAQQLDAAARACEAAAHYLSMAPPKAKGWAEGLVGTAGPSTNRPSSDSADRNKLTSGSGDLDSLGRTKRLTYEYEDLEVAEDNEPPLITVARKAFEKYRKAHEKDDEQERDDEPLEVDILITETGEIEFEERDEKEDQKRNERLLEDFEIEVDLTDAVKTLLTSMAATADQQWQHATLTITTDHVDATFDYPEQDRPQPIVVDIDLPDLPKPDFDPAFDLQPLGTEFAPGVHDPRREFVGKERQIAERLERQGWRIDARPADHASGDKNPDAMVRKSGVDEGAIIEFKTQNSGSSNAVKRSMLAASGQAMKAADGLTARREVVVDGRPVGLSEETAYRSFRRACGQPGSTVADVVHVILGDERLVTFMKEQ